MMLKIFVLCVVLQAMFSWSTIHGQKTCNMPNEEFACGSACQTTCENLGEACPIINIRCNDGCYCKDGYARNCRGICIPIKNCPPKGTCRWHRRPLPWSRKPF